MGRLFNSVATLAKTKTFYAAGAVVGAAVAGVASGELNPATATAAGGSGLGMIFLRLTLAEVMRRMETPQTGGKN